MTPDFARQAPPDGERADADRATRAPVPASAAAAGSRFLRPDAILALQRTAGNAAVGSMLRATLARQVHHTTVPMGDVKVWFYWGATWWQKGVAGGKDVSDQTGRRELTLPVHAGTEGKLVMRVVAHVSPAAWMPGSRPPEWLLKSWCEWTVKILPNGELTIGNPVPTHFGPRDSMLQQTGTPQGSANREMRQFTLTQGYVGGTESTDWSIPVWGGAGGSTAKPAATGGESFVVWFDVQGAEAPRGPDVEIGKVQIFERRTHDVHFFTERNTKVSAQERDKLMAWFRGLSKATRRRLKTAKKPQLRLETYASNTGSADENQLTYAQGRLDSVRAILDRFVADTAWDATPYGEDKPPDKDLEEAGPPEERRSHEKPDPKRLIAHLEVEDERTPGADEDDPFDLLPKD